MSRRPAAPGVAPPVRAGGHGHDLIVRAVTSGQLAVYPLPGGVITPHDHDGGPVGLLACPGIRARSRFSSIPRGRLCWHPPPPLASAQLGPGAAPPSATGCRTNSMATGCWRPGRAPRRLGPPKEVLTAVSVRRGVIEFRGCRSAVHGRYPLASCAASGQFGGRPRAAAVTLAPQMGVYLSEPHNAA